MSNTHKTCPVSVVLPCYNAADTVELSIKSAAFQSSPPAEILIFDDGSKDNSHAIIESTIAAIKDQTPSNIRYFPNSQNRGVYPVRNQALEEASQPYIAFLDSDDYWHPQKLEMQVALFEQDPSLALSCHGVVHREGTPDTLPKFEPGFEPSTKVLQHTNILMRNVIITISVMIRKPVNGLRFDESKKRGSDMLFWLETALGGGKALWIRETLSFTQKPLYGAGGLSGNIWKAEMAQQHNFYMLWKKGYISLPYSLFLRGFSLAKMVRRYMIYILRVMKGKNPSPEAINPPVSRRLIRLW